MILIYQNILTTHDVSFLFQTAFSEINIHKIRGEDTIKSGL